MSQVPEDTQAWHKRFAMACNNRAWELSTQSRTEQEDREMLDAAHASAWHWAQIGTELNRMRATMLLAEVHVLLGHSTTAMVYAREMRSYFLGRETDDWELAFTHAIFAHAAAAAGQTADYRAAYQHATAALAAIVDDGDRAVVTATFRQVPEP